MKSFSYFSTRWWAPSWGGGKSDLKHGYMQFLLTSELQCLKLLSLKSNFQGKSFEKLS